MSGAEAGALAIRAHRQRAARQEVLRRLGDRPHRDEIEVDMAGSVQGVGDDVGDIFRRERIHHSLVDAVGRAPTT